MFYFRIHEKSLEIQLSKGKQLGLSVNNDKELLFSFSDFVKGDYESILVYGTLGLLMVSESLYFIFVTGVEPCGFILGEEMVYKITKIIFVEISSKIKISNVEDIADTPDLQKMKDLIAYLTSGTFFFSYGHDLTRSTQAHFFSISKNHISDEDAECQISEFINSVNEFNIFLWNFFLLNPLIKLALSFEKEDYNTLILSKFLLRTIQGFVGISKQILFESGSMKIALVSRLSRMRAGSRFFSRGIDDDGNVSNFVETETIIFSTKAFFSFIIIRGSVPVFWDQQGLQFGQPKIQLTRTPNTTHSAFEKHFDFISKKYGAVHAVDLLSQKDGTAEKMLSETFNMLYRHFNFQKEDKRYYFEKTIFDFNSICGKIADLNRLASLFNFVSKDLYNFGYFSIMPDGALTHIQKGVFRINCLDCLDRTNLVQSVIAKFVVEFFLKSINCTPDSASATFSNLAELWADNGDFLSLIYTGSKAIKSSITREGRTTLLGLFHDAKKSAQRLYINNFLDHVKQSVVDLILYPNKKLIFPIFYYNSSGSKIKVFFEEINNTQDTHIIKKSLTFFTFSWNLNGYIPSLEIKGMILKLTQSFKSKFDILFFSLQEVVELTASQVLNTDPERIRKWEKYLKSELEIAFPSTEYILLVIHQLVGTLSLIFVEKSMLENIREVDFCIHKSGLAGIAGNKGSIFVRFSFSKYSFAFASAHLPAGQFFALERDHEVSNMINSTKFSKNRSFLSHDFIIWAGDLNYRVDIDNDIARSLIALKEFDILLAGDQLRNGMISRGLFETFREAPITFPPTYKFDVRSGYYDTSEKNRVPSWTDRILYKGSFDISVYQCMQEVCVSDHKSVYSIAIADIGE